MKLLVLKLYFSCSLVFHLFMDELVLNFIKLIMSVVLKGLK